MTLPKNQQATQKLETTMHLLDEHHLGFSWSRKAIFFEDTDEAEFHHKTHGNIYLFGSNKKRLVGKFEVTYIDIIGALNADLRIMDVFDQTGESLFFYKNLMSKKDDAFYLDKIYKAYGLDISLGNLLMINRLELVKAYRGEGLGSEIIKRIERVFGGGANLIALKAFPLQHEKSSIKRPKSWIVKMGYHSLNHELFSSSLALLNYYKSIGFYQVSSEALMIKIIGE